MIIKKPRYALVGSRGNLGKVVSQLLESRGYEVIAVARHGKGDGSAELVPFVGINFQSNEIPDVVINLANYYTAFPTGPDYNLMKDSILGVATAIANYSQKTAVPVVSASTYFQYCPKNLNPWSEYALLKSKAQELLLNFSEKYSFGFTDFVLFDNYGGDRKSKFFDLALESSMSNLPLQATEGEQIVNLTHIKDHATAFVEESVRLVLTRSNSSNIYQIKSTDTYTLRNLVSFIEGISGKKLNISWGVIPYREREVFEIWNTGLENPPSWMPNYKLEKYVRDYLYA